MMVNVRFTMSMRWLGNNTPDQDTQPATSHQPTDTPLTTRPSQHQTRVPNPQPPPRGRNAGQKIALETLVAH
jgi:hypothetical protein